ncbi:MAG: vitamin K epoxide reductase family protein [Chloroflexaceae bacterium]|nr:vitamin K epoxide reductase family protein [Chloroflexaceae bacterium]
MVERSLYPRMVGAVLALISMFNAGYLQLSRMKMSDLVCPVGGGCETVQISPWSTIPPGSGIPISLIGLLGSTLLFVLLLRALQTDSLGPLPLPPTLLLISSIGVCFSLYLTVVQLFVIQAVCFWCALSALLELGMLGAIVLDWRAWRRGRGAIQTGHIAGATPRARS